MRRRSPGADDASQIPWCVEWPHTLPVSGGPGHHREPGPFTHPLWVYRRARGLDPAVLAQDGGRARALSLRLRSVCAWHIVRCSMLLCLLCTHWLRPTLCPPESPRDAQRRGRKAVGKGASGRRGRGGGRQGGGGFFIIGYGLAFIPSPFPAPH